MPIDQRGLTAKSPKRPKKIDPETSIEFGTFIGDRQITLILDLKAMTPNHCLPWRKRHDREKGQKREVMFALITCKCIIKMPCVLKFTRYGPKLLDAHDNLPMSLKKIVDQTAAEITGEHRPGLADSNKGFTFLYDQVKSKKYYVKIEISW